MKHQFCDICASTGVLRASVVKKNVDGIDYNDHIDVVLCGAHDMDAAEKSLAGMEKQSGLPVNVLGVERKNQ